MKTIKVKDMRSFTTSYGKKTEVTLGICSLDIKNQLIITSENWDENDIEVGDSVRLAGGILVDVTESCGTLGYIWGPATLYFKSTARKVLVLPSQISKKQKEALSSGRIRLGSKVWVECKDSFIRINSLGVTTLHPFIEETLLLSEVIELCDQAYKLALKVFGKKLDLPQEWIDKNIKKK